jgi:hypothetical protein
MRRRGTAWIVTLLLAAVGTQVAHVLDYWLVAPDHHEREELLRSTGHGYTGHVPLAIGLALASVLVLLVRGARRADAHRGLWAFALVAPVVFATQEHAERFVHDGRFPWSASLDRTFALGLVLQLPFALAAYALARLLVTAARAVGRVLGALPHTSPGLPHALPRPVVGVHLVRLAPLALGYAERGPPLAR